MADSLSYLDPIDQTRRQGTSRIGMALLISAVLMLAVIGASLMRVGRAQPTSGPAPDFTLPTFDGGTFNLAAQRGKVVVINFWASWCIPCRDEAPVLQDIWERYRERGVVLVGVAYLDVERDSLAFMEEFGITYPNGLDAGEKIARQYEIQGVPETFVVDQEGNIVKFYVGPAGEGDLDAILEPLLQS